MQFRHFQPRTWLEVERNFSKQNAKGGLVSGFVNERQYDDTDSTRLCLFV